MHAQIRKLDSSQLARDPEAQQNFQAQGSVYQRLIENDQSGMFWTRR